MTVQPATLGPSGLDFAPSILIVGDSRLQRRILVCCLEGRDLTIREAGSVDAAFDACEDDLPDIIICDWVMPVEGGLDLCRRVRERFSETYVYFIMLTTQLEKSELARALEDGADDFLVKPVHAAELDGRVAAGARVLSMQRSLRKKNRIITRTLNRMRKMNDELERDLSEARKLQSALVPSAPIRWGDIEATFFLRSAGHVGGDLVGAITVSDREALVYSLDVSGHGIASALITARIAAWLGSAGARESVALRRDGQTVHARDPVEICAELNELFLTNFSTEHYFTIAIAHLDTQSGACRIVQAGHPYPLVQRGDGGVEFVGDGGLPIGLIGEAGYTAHDIRLGPGDRLLMYSDGVTESETAEGGMLGETGLADIVTRLAERRGQPFLDGIADGVLAAADELADDLSAVVIEYPRATV